jgi:hypothetical protein
MNFTSREMAVALWLSVALIFVIRVAGKSLLAVLRALAQPVILRLLGVATAYLALLIAVFAYFDFWGLPNLKNTLIWVTTVASVRIGKAISIDTDRRFFAKTLRETLGVTFIVEFLIEKYTFGIWTELVLVPFTTFLAMLLAVGKTDKKFQSVNTLLQWVLAMIGLTYIGHSIYEFAHHYRELEPVEAARELFLPVILSLLFMPFLFALNVYSAYEQIFTGLHWALEDPALRRYAKRQSLLRFGTNIDSLKRWRRLMMMERPASREEIDRLIAEIAVVRRHERNPTAVDPKDGWQPQAAMRFLAGEGFINEDYHRSYDEWCSGSKPLKVSEGASLNTITYRVAGSVCVAYELVLELSVWLSEDGAAEEADQQFIGLVAKLMNAALGAESNEATAECGDGEVFDREWRGFRLALSREDWPNVKGGYERQFIIQTEGAREAARRREAELDAFIEREIEKEKGNEDISHHD